MPEQTQPRAEIPEQPNSQPNSQSQSQSNLQSNLQSNSQSNSQPQSQSQSQSNLQPHSQPHSQSHSQPHSQSQPQPHSQPHSQSQPKMDAHPNSGDSPSTPPSSFPPPGSASSGSHSPSSSPSHSPSPGSASPGSPSSPPPDPLILLSKFTLYETKEAFYIVGSNSRETRFRILEIPLKDSLEFKHGPVLARDQVLLRLAQIEAAAAAENDVLNKRITAWGILGCIRFTGLYYLCLVTRCSQVALLGGHYIFHIDETKLVPIIHSASWRQPDRNSTEARLASIFYSLDLTKTFYFSPSYDLTHTLQTNLTRERQAMASGRQSSTFEEMYVWNSHLLAPMLQRFPDTMEWCLCLVHGFIDQAKISVFGTPVYITLIARRSHYFAGARFFKRGVNNQGHVANEVETEQIVSSQLTSSFHDPKKGSFSSPRYTSYVQHRGSIALPWSQDTANISPKPPIHLDNVDPYYAAGARHFDDLLDRYSSPIRVFNLVKQKEHTPHESVVATEFKNLINYLNTFLPQKNKILYTAWDMSGASKSKSSKEVIEYLEAYAKETLKATGIFKNGASLEEDISLQQGVCRTNCVDCLDRTNAAQSVIGKCALGVQLQSIGIIDSPTVQYDSDAVDLLTEMYHDHGDTLALQYGGSNLVNSVETYRKINQWRSHSRDLIESIRRFYTNSFVDAQRQDAINLFLGNYQYSKSLNFHLWDLGTDYYLHNLPSLTQPYSYTNWFSPVHLLDLRDRINKNLTHHELQENSLGPAPGFQLHFEHYWNRLYRPRQLTSLDTLFVMKMNSTDRYQRSKTVQSPFEVHRKPKLRREVSDTEPLAQNNEGPEVADLSILDHQEELYSNYVHSTISDPDPSVYTPTEPLVDASEYEATFHAEWESELPLKWPVTLA